MLFICVFNGGSFWHVFCLLQNDMGCKTPRILIPGLAYHVRMQCNNKEFRFRRAKDFRHYLSIMACAKAKYGFYLYDYALMHTHVHLFIMIPGPVLLDKIMWYVSRTFSQTYNKREKRCGHLWMGPYKASVVNDDKYGMAVLRYFSQNAPMAGIVKDPKEWPWCGYCFYAYGEPNELLTPCPTYLGFGNEPITRQNFYRTLIESLAPNVLNEEEKWLMQKLKRHRPLTSNG